jgi:hypothetical protein
VTNTTSNSEKIKSWEALQETTLVLPKEVEGWLSYSLSTIVLHSQLFWLIVGGVSIFRQIKLGKKILKVFLQSSRVLGAIPGDDTRSNPEKIKFWEGFKDTTRVLPKKSRVGSHKSFLQRFALPFNC